MANPIHLPIWLPWLAVFSIYRKCNYVYGTSRLACFVRFMNLALLMSSALHCCPVCVASSTCFSTIVALNKLMESETVVHG